jgi:hypothetical protein
MSSHININLIKGKLLHNDANQRDKNRDVKLAKEKEKRTESSPGVNSLRDFAMRGAVGKKANKKPGIASTPSKNQSIPISVCTVYTPTLVNENPSIILKSQDGTEVSWPVSFYDNYEPPTHLELVDGVLVAKTEYDIDTSTLQQSFYPYTGKTSREFRTYVLPYEDDSAVVVVVYRAFAHVDWRVKARRRTSHTTTPVAGEPFWERSPDDGVYHLNWTLCPFSWGHPYERSEDPPPYFWIYRMDQPAVYKWGWQTRNNELNYTQNAYLRNRGSLYMFPATQAPQYPNIPKWAYDMNTSHDVFEYSVDIVRSFDRVDDEYVCCALVSGDKIKKIPTPATFRTRILSLIDNWTGITQSDTAVAYPNTTLTYEKTFSWRYDDFWFVNLYKFYHLSDTIEIAPGSKAYSIHGSLETFFLPNDPYNIWNNNQIAPTLKLIYGEETINEQDGIPVYGPVFSLDNYSSAYYGDPIINKHHYVTNFGTLGVDGTNFTWGAGPTTPGIYSLLNLSFDPEKMNNDYYIDSRNVKAVLQADGATIPTKTVVLETFAEQTVRVYTTPLVDSATSAPVDPGTLEPAGKLDLELMPSKPEYSYFNVYGYNWNNSTYCGQNLQALGFNLADLAPIP